MTNRAKVVVTLNGKRVYALLDTGADFTFITVELLHSLPGYTEQGVTHPRIKEVVTANETPIKVVGVYHVNIVLGGLSYTLPVRIVPTMVYPFVLGRDFCVMAGIEINFPSRTIMARPSVKLTVMRTCTVPPGACTQVRLRVNDPDGTWEGIEGMVDKQTYEIDGVTIDVEPTMATVCEGTIVVLVSHFGMDKCVLKEGDELGQLDDIRPEALSEQTAEPEGLFALCMSADEGENIDSIASAAIKSGVTVAPELSLSDIIDLSHANITNAEKVELRTMLQKNADVFVEKDGKLGHTDLVYHTIRTLPTQPPLRQRAYRAGHHAKQIIEDQVQDMLTKGLITPSCSPWASPVVLVTKRDGTPRFCVDFRRLNAVTIMDSFPLPDIRQCLDIFGTVRAKYFSSLDMRSAFWQVAMDPDTVEKSAFITSEGLFQFNVMPFGLCGAPSTFQRLMSVVLRGLIWKNCLAYLDDVMVMSATFSQHLIDLEAVFERLRAAGLKLGPAKCFFAKTQILFLGHLVSGSGIEVDPGKTKALMDLNEPKTVKEVRSFLGLAGYYRRFCKGYAQIVHPLHQLTRPSVEYVWTEKCQKAFNKVKQMLTTAPVLAYPMFDEPYMIMTDASGIAVGHVLAQIHEQLEKVIAYGGRSLRKHEKNYTVTEQEFLAIVYAIAVCDCYIRYVPCTIYTDHVALKGLINTSEPKGRLARWIIALQTYQLTIKYKAGKKHLNADAMSRQEYAEEGIDLDPPHCIFAVTTRSAGRLPPVTATVKFQTVLPNEIDLYVQYGEIPQAPVEAIICPVDGTIADQKGVANEIFRLAGAISHEQYISAVDMHGTLAVGRTVLTTAGRLPAQQIVHVAFPKYMTNRKDNRERLYGTVYNALREAAYIPVKSVALPAICVGKYGFSKEVGADILKTAITAFVNSADRREVKAIYVIVNNLANCKAVSRAWRLTEPRPRQTPRQRRSAPTGTTQAGPRGKTPGEPPAQIPAGTDPSHEQPPERARRTVPGPGPDIEETEHWIMPEGDEEQLNELQQGDPEIYEIWDFLVTGTLPEDKNKARQVSITAEDFCFQNDLLYHIWIKPGKGPASERTCLQLVVPTKLRYGIMYHYHTHVLAGHRGIDGTCVAIKSRYYWPHMTRDITDYVTSCPHCAQAARAQNRRNIPLQIVPVEGPFERVHMDILGPFVTSEDNYKYVLVMVDSFTRWTEMKPLLDQTAPTVADNIFDEWVCRYGVPRVLVTDRGTNFLSHIVTQLNDRLGIKKVTTSSYHPQGNAVVERKNLDVTSTLKKLVVNNPHNWPKYLAPTAFAMNTAVCTSTNYTPYFLMFGREADRPIDRRMPCQVPVAQNVQQRVNELVKRIEYFDQQAKATDEQNKLRYKKNYDSKVKDQSLIVGDRVYLYTPQIAAKMKTGRKLLSPWVGPYMIVKFVSSTTVKLRNCADMKMLELPVHINRLKRFWVSGLTPPAKDPTADGTPDVPVEDETAAQAETNDNDGRDNEDPSPDEKTPVASIECECAGNCPSPVEPAVDPLCAEESTGIPASGADM